jgi:chloride channel 3/4/5
MPRPDPAELYELTEDGQIRSPTQTHSASQYVDGSTIDWLQEEAVERERTNSQRAQHGVRGLLLPWCARNCPRSLNKFTRCLRFDAARMWLVVILIGIGIGVTGGWLDVLVKWYFSLLVLLIKRPNNCDTGWETSEKAVARTDFSTTK